jgi:hypothetical protein
MEGSNEDNENFCDCGRGDGDHLRRGELYGRVAVKAIRFLIARLRAWWHEYIVDEGWEDETGFHRGRMFENDK